MRVPPCPEGHPIVRGVRSSPAFLQLANGTRSSRVRQHRFWPRHPASRAWPQSSSDPDARRKAQHCSSHDPHCVRLVPSRPASGRRFFYQCRVCPAPTSAPGTKTLDLARFASKSGKPPSGTSVFASAPRHPLPQLSSHLETVAGLSKCPLITTHCQAQKLQARPCGLAPRKMPDPPRRSSSASAPIDFGVRSDDVRVVCV